MRAAALLAALAVALLLPPAPGGRLGHGSSRPGRRGGAYDPRSVAAGVAGIAVALLLGSAGGLVAGGATAIGLARWMSTLPSRAAAERDRALRADLPVAAELLAACLAAGAAPAAALPAVATALRGEVGGVLAAASRRWALTGSLAAAFAEIPEARVDGPLHPLAAAFARAERGGGSAVPLLVGCARELRDARRTDLDAAARRAGALAVAPLGLCFLPAFVLVGIVPLVAGLLRQGVPVG